MAGPCAPLRIEPDGTPGPTICINPGSAESGSGGDLAFVVVFFLAFAALAVVVLLLYRRLASRPGPVIIGQERAEMPSVPSLAVAAFVRADASWVGAESFASEALALAAAGDVVIESPDGSRVAVSVRRQSLGAASETVVVEALRSLGSEPRLDPWGSGRPPWWRPFRRAVIKEARAAGLVKHMLLGNLAPGDAAPPAAVVAAAMVAFTSVKSDDPLGTLLGFGITFAIIGAVVTLAGWELTDAGRLLRRELEGHRRFLARRVELKDVPAIGAVVRGDVLPTAAALGLAPRAAAQIAPRWSLQPGILQRSRWVRSNRRGTS